MAIKPIVGFDLQHAHPQQKGYSTDAYYVRLANGLLKDFQNAAHDLIDVGTNIKRYAAVSLASYLEDVVADVGVWRTFSSLCLQQFGQPVPLYHDRTEEYYFDEPSLMAVRYLVWNAACEMDDVWWNVDSPQLELLARLAYARLSEAFENAPINTRLADDVKGMLERATHDFNNLRVALTWVYSNCYVTRSGNTEELLQSRMDEARDTELPMSEPMQHYYAIMHCIFAYRIGPLAMYPNEYLTALMRTKSMYSAAQDVADIETIPFGQYRYVPKGDGQMLRLERTDGRTIEVAASELNLPERMLAQNNACMAAFVCYQDRWYMNGIMMPFQCTDQQWDELCKDDPKNIPAGTRNATPDDFLKPTGGREMLFFKDIAEMEHFLKKKMKFADSLLGFFSEVPSETRPNPMLFIDRLEEEQHCLQFTFGFTPCIAAPDNPYYDAAIARKETFEMFWNDDSISSHAILWLLERNYIPQLFDEHFFCFDNTPQEAQADARFLLRYMRRENY